MTTTRQKNVPGWRIIRHLDARIRHGKLRRWPAVLAVFCLIAYGASGQLESYFELVEGHYFTSNGVRLHYTDQGQGEPVILLHGFAMNQDFSWRHAGVIDALAKNYRVIGLDQRGHGLSEKPHDPRAYGIEMSRDIIRLMDHLDLPKAHIVGTSMGALVAMRVMVDFPDRVLSVAPCAMGLAKPSGPNMAALVSLINSLDAGGGVDPLLRRLYPDHDPSYFTTTAVNTLVSYYNDEKALAAVARALVELQVTPRELRKVHVPVLTIIGSYDPLIKEVDDLRGLIPNHKIVVLDGVDHFSMSSWPSFTKQLIDFIAEHSDTMQDHPAPMAALR